MIKLKPRKVTRCCNCEKECTVHEVQEDRGEFWGMPAYETMWYSDCCDDDVYTDEALYVCEKCGNYCDIMQITEPDGYNTVSMCCGYDYKEE